MQKGEYFGVFFGAPTNTVPWEASVFAVPSSVPSERRALTSPSTRWHAVPRAPSLSGALAPVQGSGCKHAPMGLPRVHPATLCV